MKKMLIAGGGYADIPLIKAAKKLGYFVITSGNRPDDMGHPYADKVSLADFSDAEAILSVAKENKVDGICPCCNDFSALSAAYAAEKLGLPGHDTFEVTRLLHHKDLYRNFAREHQIPSPQAHAFGSEEEAIAKAQADREARAAAQQGTEPQSTAAEKQHMSADEHANMDTEHGAHGH